MAGNEAMGLWVLAGSWCARHSPEGRIVREIMPLLGGSDELAARLVRAGLWRRVKGGYQMLRAVPAVRGCQPLTLWDIERGGHRQKIPDDIRALVMRRDGGQCVVCGSEVDMTLDHILPWSKGGPDTAANLRVLCRPCNSSKGAKV